MPQYLAVDYLTDIICHKQATLSRMLIVWPSHLSASFTTSKNLRYREPWQKGLFEFNKKELIRDSLKDLSFFTIKDDVLDFEHLQFNGLEYHSFCGKVEEIVPSSNPESESESYVLKHGPDKFSNDHHKSKTKYEIFTIYNVDCFSTFFANNVLHISNRLCCCKYLEPFLSTNLLQQHVPVLSTLLTKLNVFDISDPIEFVENVMKKVDKTEKIIYDSNTSDKQTMLTKFNLTDLAISMYELQNYEIPNELMYIDETITNTVLYDSENKLKFLNDSLVVDDNAEKSCSIWENCSRDIAKLIDTQSTNNCQDSPWIFLEQLDYSSTTNFIQAQTSDEISASNNEPLLLSLPFILEGSSLLKTVPENAIDTLNIERFQLPLDDFRLLSSDLYLSNYLLNIELFPDSSKENYISYMIPELAVKHEIDFPTKSVVCATSLLLDVTPQPHQKNLELVLAWDPVAHATDEMSYVRQTMQHESLSITDSYEVHAGSDYEDDFLLILNDSADDVISLSAPSIVDEAVLVSSISNCPLTKKVEKNVIPACSSIRPRLDEAGDSAHKSSVDVSSDPLSNFMMLMGKQNKTELPWKTEFGESKASSDTSIVNEAVKRLSVKRIRSIKENFVDTTNKSTSASANEDIGPCKKLKKNMPLAQNTSSLLLCSEVVKKKKWSKKIDVCITGLSLDLPCLLEKEAFSLLESLQSRDILAKNATLPLVTREMTRYLVKQQQKKLAMNENDENRRTLLDIEMFDRIVSTFYLIVQVSFTSALALLHSSLQQLQKQKEHAFDSQLRKYFNLLKQCLHKLKERVAEARHSDVRETPLLHPKMAELRRRLLKWRSKRKASESRSHVIVVCCTVCRYLFMDLCKELGQVDASYPDVRLRPTSVVIDVNVLTSSDVLSAFETNNVLILGEHMVFENFPWDSVDLLVEYEFDKDSAWKNLSSSKMIKHLAFESVLPSVHINLEDSVAERKFYNQVSASVPPKDTSLLLIGSEKFTSFGNLLHLLETRYDVMVVERCYKRILSEVEVCHPDLIFNERTCLLLEDVSDLTEQDGDCVKNLLCILTMLRRMFTTCFVIVMTAHDEESKESYPLAGSTPLNLARLQASIKQLSNCAEDFEVKLICCFTVECLAEAIHTLASQVTATSDGGPRKSRSWIETEPGDEECFLLHFPCVNSFVAQRYLSVTSVRETCRMDRDQFLSTSDALDIPRRMAEGLYQCLHFKYDPTELSSLLHSSSHLPPSESTENLTHHLSAFVSNRSACFHDNNVFYDNKPDYNPAGPDRFQTRDTDRFDPDRRRLKREANNSINPECFHHETEPTSSSTCFNLQNTASVCLENDRVIGRKNFSQFPLSDASFQFSRGDVQDADEYNRRRNLDHVMMSAQQKLREFVRSNPDRADPDASTSHFSAVDDTSNSTAFVRDNHWIRQQSVRKASGYESRDVSVPNYSENQRSGRATYRLLSDEFGHNSNEAKPIYNDSSDNRCRQPCFEGRAKSTPHTSDLRNCPSYDSLGDFRSNPARRRFRRVTESTGFISDRDDLYATGTSGSTNIGVAQPFPHTSWRPEVVESKLPPAVASGRPVVMTPNFRKKTLMYEKVPGCKNGQTRLTFY